MADTFVEEFKQMTIREAVTNQQAAQLNAALQHEPEHAQAAASNTPVMLLAVAVLARQRARIKELEAMAAQQNGAAQTRRERTPEEELAYNQRLDKRGM
jgi:flagellar biosynthesis GTPase FlhF